MKCQVKPLGSNGFCSAKLPRNLSVFRLQLHVLDLMALLGWLWPEPHLNPLHLRVTVGTDTATLSQPFLFDLHKYLFGSSNSCVGHAMFGLPWMRSSHPFNLYEVVRTFGSCATGFKSAGSDVDMACAENQRESLGKLGKLREFLKLTLR